MATQPRYCLAIRVFARSPAEIPAMLQRLEIAVERVRRMTLPGSDELIFTNVLILVWENQKDFPTISDCGQSFDICRERFQHWAPQVEVLKVSQGDLFVGATNHALTYVVENTTATWLMFMSPEVSAHLTPQLCKRFVQAADDRVLYAGVALPELGERGQRGFTGNTLAAWHVEALWRIGGFDSIAAAVPEHEVSSVIQYWDGQEISKIPRCGVEEVVPMARLVVRYGRCLVVILPEHLINTEAASVTEERLRLHRVKLATKAIRQNAMLYSRGLSPDLIEYGTRIMYNVFGLLGV